MNLGLQNAQVYTHAHPLITILYIRVCNDSCCISHAVTTESEKWEVWLVVVLLVTLLAVTVVVAIVGWVAFVWKLKTAGMQKGDGEGGV